MRQRASSRVTAPGVPHVLGLVHSLWPDVRVLRSPLLLLPVAMGVAVWMMREHTAAFQRHFLSHLPLLAAFVALGLAQSRSVHRGLEHDWLLAGRPAEELHRAVFCPVWLLWWMVMLVQATALEIARFPSVVGRLSAQPPAVALRTPGGTGFEVGDLPGIEAWVLPVRFLVLALTPLYLAAWSWMLRWLTEWAMSHRRSVVLPCLAGLGVALALRHVGPRNTAELQFHTALLLQYSWPEEWSLTGRLLAGSYVGWAVLPGALVVLALVFRALARRRDRLASLRDQA